MFIYGYTVGLPRYSRVKVILRMVGLVFRLVRSWEHLQRLPLSVSEVWMTLFQGRP